MPFDHFDHIAGIYDRSSEFILDEDISRLLNLSAGMTLLDAGGGTGRVTAVLRNQVRFPVVADPSKGMLRYAQKKHLATVCAPAEALPFAANTFDRIIMVDALHHVCNAQFTARELWRVLATAGRILIIEPDPAQFGTKVMAFLEKALLMRSHFLSLDRIKALFTDQHARLDSRLTDKNAILLVEKVREV